MVLITFLSNEREAQLMVIRRIAGHFMATIFESRPLLKKTYGPGLDFGPKDFRKLTEQAMKA